MSYILKSKYILEILLVLLAALALGVGSAVGALWLEKQHLGRIANGPWETTLEAGSVDAGMYSRAVVALFGTLALDPSEVVYFISLKDTDGEALSNNCDYRVEGGDYDTHWWSLTVYNNFFFIENDADRYSYSSTTTKRGADGKWTIHLSSELKEGNWLPLGDKPGVLTLSFRLFNPGVRVMNNLATMELPRIVKEGCR